MNVNKKFNSLKKQIKRKHNLKNFYPNIERESHYINRNKRNFQYRSRNNRSRK